MSVQNSNVSAVLLTSGNAAVLGVGKRLDELAVGQIGVFDYHTNLSIDASLAATGSNRAVYFAVGLDTEGGSTLNDVQKSPVFYKDFVTGYSMRCYTKTQEKIIKIEDICADCNTDYTLIIRAMTPGNFQFFGHGRQSFVYSYRTTCCGCDADCPSGNCGELAIALYNLINDDPRGCFTAKMVAKADADNVSATGLSEEDVTAAVAADPTDCPVLHITSVTSALVDFCKENNQEPTNFVDFEVSVKGFTCCGNIDTIQEYSIAEGSGVSMKIMEEWSSGFGDAGPYRQGTSGYYNERVLYADPAEKYNQIVIEATKGRDPKGGFDMSNAPVQVIIGIPFDDTTTSGGLLDITDPLVAKNGFDALKNDFTDCPDSDSVNHANEGFDGGSFDSAKDGLG